MADNKERWRTWDEIRAEAVAAGRIDEARVAEHRERLLDAQRAYRLAEIRRHQGLTQAAVAATMHVSQRRVSAVEHGELSHSQLGTIAAYVAALGGRVEIVANFGDEHLVIADAEREGGARLCQRARHGKARASRSAITRRRTSGRLAAGRRQALARRRPSGKRTGTRSALPGQLG